MKKTYIVYAESMSDAVNKVRKMRKATSRKVADADFYGVPGIKYIDHGEWADPEVEYKGVRFNYFDLEDGLWELYKADMNEQGKDATEAGFESWVAKNKDQVYEDAEYLANAHKKTRDSRRPMRKPIARKSAIRKDSVSRKTVRRVVRRHR